MVALIVMMRGAVVGEVHGSNNGELGSIGGGAACGGDVVPPCAVGGISSECTPRGPTEKKGQSYE